MKWYEIVTTVLVSILGAGGIVAAWMKIRADRRAAKTVRENELADRAADKADRYDELDGKVDELDAKVEEYNAKAKNRMSVMEEAIAGLRADIRYGLDNLDNKLNDALGHVKQGNDMLTSRSINDLDDHCALYLSRQNVSPRELRNLYRELESCKRIMGVDDVEDDPDIHYISTQIEKVSKLGGKENT